VTANQLHRQARYQKERDLRVIHTHFFGIDAELVIQRGVHSLHMMLTYLRDEDYPKKTKEIHPLLLP
jgi:hypothetical protein